VSLQGLFEFGLYIPGLAWTTFVLLGWLLARVPDRRDQPEIQSTKVKKNA